MCLYFYKNILSNIMEDKVLLYQYGKVGSTSIRDAIPNSIYTHNKLPSYQPYRLIQTHSHDVAEDVLKKHPDILVIVIVRLPVSRNLSDFWENIYKNCPLYRYNTIEQIDDIFNSRDYITYTEDWMTTCFNHLGIDIDSFRFDVNKRFSYVESTPRVLFLRFEDLDYVTKRVLPNIGITVKKKTNTSKSKSYGAFYSKHKQYHKISDNTCKQIESSTFLRRFYTDNELINHILEWKKLPFKSKTNRRPFKIGMGGIKY